MYVSPIGLGQVVPRGARPIRVPRLLHRRRGMGQTSGPNHQCQYQMSGSYDSATGKFYDAISGQEFSGPPWCATNIPSFASPSCPAGLIVPCAATNIYPDLVQVSDFNPSAYIPPIEACANGTQVGSGQSCPASAGGPAAGQGPASTAPVISPIATAPVPMTLPLQTVTEGGGSLPANTVAVAVPTVATPAATPSLASCFSLFSQFGIPDPCLGPIGVTTLGAGIVAVLIVASMFGGRKR